MGLPQSRSLPYPLTRLIQFPIWLEHWKINQSINQNPWRPGVVWVPRQMPSLRRSPIEIHENANRAHLRTHYLAVKWCDEQSYSFRQPKSQMSECRSNTICAVVEWPDHYYSDDLSYCLAVFKMAIKVMYNLYPYQGCEFTLYGKPPLGKTLITITRKVRPKRQYDCRFLGKSV